MFTGKGPFIGLILTVAHTEIRVYAQLFEELLLLFQNSTPCPRSVLRIWSLLRTSFLLICKKSGTTLHTLNPRNFQSIEDPYLCKISSIGSTA